jgi:hypothetical protein
MGVRRTNTGSPKLEALRPQLTPPPASRVIDKPPPASERTAMSALAARATIDTIVQSSVVELFHAHGMSVAPIGVSAVGVQLRYHDTVGLIGFDAASFSGTLTISLPDAVFDAQAEARRKVSDKSTLVDWTHELANQLLGRVKNRLTLFQITLRPRLPSTMSGVSLERVRKRAATELLYRFRALRGEVLVTLDAPFDKAMLAYSGAAHVVKEGDVIMF